MSIKEALERYPQKQLNTIPYSRVEQLLEETEARNRVELTQSQRQSYQHLYDSGVIDAIMELAVHARKEYPEVHFFNSHEDGFRVNPKDFNLPESENPYIETEVYAKRDGTCEIALSCQPDRENNHFVFVKASPLTGDIIVSKVGDYTVVKQDEWKDKDTGRQRIEDALVAGYKQPRVEWY